MTPFRGPVKQGLIRTSTRSPRLWLLFVGLALLWRNVYVWLHWEVLARLEDFSSW